MSPWPTDTIGSITLHFVSLDFDDERTPCYIRCWAYRKHRPTPCYIRCGAVNGLISRATPPEMLSRPELLRSTVYLLKDILEQSLWRVSCKSQTCLRSGVRIVHLRIAITWLHSILEIIKVSSLWIARYRWWRICSWHPSLRHSQEKGSSQCNHHI